VQDFRLGRVPWIHVAAAQVAAMPAQRFRRQVGRVLSVRESLGSVEVVEQQRLVVGAGAFFDDQVGALARREAAEVGEALLGDDDLYVVLGVVDVRDHRHNCRDGSMLRR